jgi:hypothetical protein
MAVVLIIAIVLLLIGNYVKNYKSGVALSYQPVELTFQKDNPTDKDLIVVATSNTELKNFSQKTISSSTFNKYVVLGIIASAKPTAGYSIKIDKIYLRGSQVNVNYRIVPPEKGQVAADVISYPNLVIKLEKANLPTNVPVEFRFNNLSNLRTELVSKIIK